MGKEELGVHHAASVDQSIAYDARQIKEERTGLGRYTFAVLRALLEQPSLYERLRILTDLRSDSGDNRLFRIVRELVNRNEKASIEVIDAPLYSLRHHVAVARWVRRVGAHRYFYPYFDLPLGVPCPTQFVLHDLFVLQMPDYLVRFRLPKTLYYRWIIGYSLRRAHVQCVTVSETSAAVIREFFGPHIRNPIRVALEAPVELTVDEKPEAGILQRVQDPFILYVGDRRPHKNLRRVIEIFRHLKLELGYRGSLVFAGSRRNFGFDPEAFAAGIPDVIFLGPVSDATRNELFWRMQALILLSRHEGFGLPIVEAGSLGKRLITSDSGAMKEVAPPWACLVPADASAAAAARRIQDYLESPTDGGAEGYASRFCWHRCVREIFATPPVVGMRV